MSEEIKIIKESLDEVIETENSAFESTRKTLNVIIQNFDNMSKEDIFEMLRISFEGIAILNNVADKKNAALNLFVRLNDINNEAISHYQQLTDKKNIIIGSMQDIMVKALRP